MKRLYLNCGNYTVALIKRMYSGSKNTTSKPAAMEAVSTLSGRYIILITVIISFFFFTQSTTLTVCGKIAQTDVTGNFPGMTQTVNDFVKIRTP